MKKNHIINKNENLPTILLIFASCILAVDIFWYIQKPNSANIMVILQCISGIFLIFVPMLITKLFKIQLPRIVKNYYWFFLSISIFMGTCLHFVNLFVWWDKLLHFLSPTLLSMVGYILAMQLSKKKEISVSLVILFGFCFAAFCGIIWEFWEFSWDGLLDMNLQRYRSGATLLQGRTALYDTMLDLLTNTLGAIVCLIYTYGKAKKNTAYIKQYQLTTTNT